MSIEEIKASICDNYCKWPFNTETQAELNEICKECPLNELSDGKTCEDTISRAEAQTALMMSKDVYLYIGHPTIRVSDAVQAIRDLSSVTLQRNSNADEKHVGNTLEAVSREACLMCLTGEFVPDKEYKPEELIAVFSKRIKALPPVTVRQTGEWIMPIQDDGMSDPIYYQVRCSECGFDLDPQTWHQELHQYDADRYCPNFGARMRD